MKKKKTGILLMSTFLAMAISSPIVNAQPTAPRADPDNPYAAMGWTYVTDNINLTSPYGWRFYNGINEFHKGIDIRAKELNVYAPQKGSILSAGVFSDGLKYVALKTIDNHPSSGNKLVARYLHLKSYSVTTGQLNITKGQVLGISGNTGNVAYHLHFDVNFGNQYSGTYIDSSNTINPILFWPNLLISSSIMGSNDNPLTEKESIHIKEVDDEENYFEDTLINYVGEAKFWTWFNSLPENERKLSNFKEHFNISDQLESSIKATAREVAAKNN